MVAHTARRGGVPFAAVLSGKTPRVEFAPYGPAAILNTVAELPRLLMEGGKTS